LCSPCPIEPLLVVDVERVLLVVDVESLVVDAEAEAEARRLVALLEAEEPLGQEPLADAVRVVELRRLRDLSSRYTSRKIAIVTTVEKQAILDGTARN
jgi:hypothetical protein